MIGNEAERQFYLAAAGIRMWYAREPLPGAAPSSDFDFVEFDSVPAAIPKPESMPAPPSAKAGRGKDHIAQLQSLMDAKKSPEPAPEPEKVQAQAGTPELKVPSQGVRPEAGGPQEDALVESPVNEDRREIPKVTLQTWVGKRVMLMAVLSDESSLALQQTLAGNILKALGEVSPRTLDVVRWPLFNNGGISLNDIGHLVDVVSAQIETYKDKVVVSLGEDSDWMAAALGKQPEVCFAASLANLAGTPALKRDLWQRLKPIRPNLS